MRRKIGKEEDRVGRWCWGRRKGRVRRKIGKEEDRD